MQTNGGVGFNFTNLQGVKTMRLTGNISGVSLTVLNDIGASHNFIAPFVVLALGLQVDMSQKLGESRRWTSGMG